MATFTALVGWLGVPAETFLTGDGNQQQLAPEPMALASTLLKGNKKLSPEAMKALKALVEAAYRFAQETR
jgi:hypothetical protein